MITICITENGKTLEVFSLSICQIGILLSVPIITFTSLAVGGVGRVACQGFLVREACVGVLVGGAGFLLSGVQ